MAFQTIEIPYLPVPGMLRGCGTFLIRCNRRTSCPRSANSVQDRRGLSSLPARSLPTRYANHFFYCNYTGNGGVESFAVRPDGAGFQIVDHQDFCKPVFASDIDFGYDGKMYIADYAGNPWDRSTSGGRVYTLFDPSRLKSVEQTRRSSRRAFQDLSIDRLAELLHDADMRVRLRAQFELVTRDGAVEPPTKIAKSDDNQLTRLHAIWGLGQFGRVRPDVLQAIVELLNDNDMEVRADGEGRG